MSDNYQAVYDAVRSRFHCGDVGEAVQSVVRDAFEPVSIAVHNVSDEFINAAREQYRPSVLFRPALYPDGDQWCALYGDNLQVGVAGFGDSPANAMAEFDTNWTKALR